jgi:hypothetical protein
MTSDRQPKGDASFAVATLDCVYQIVDGLSEPSAVPAFVLSSLFLVRFSWS